jgi:transposase
VVLDNYGIHSSELVKRALTDELDARIVLLFLPPYSPKHNRIERLWRELHANVTRNHRCRTLSELLDNVESFLRRASPYPGTKASLIRTSKRRAA